MRFLTLPNISPLNYLHSTVTAKGIQEGSKRRGEGKTLLLPSLPPPPNATYLLLIIFIVLFTAEGIKEESPLK